MTAKGAVACGHAETAAAAAEILEEGGTAFDAVLAAMASAVVALDFSVHFPLRGPGPSSSVWPHFSGSLLNAGGGCYLLLNLLF